MSRPMERPKKIKMVHKVENAIKRTLYDHWGGDAGRSRGYQTEHRTRAAVAQPAFGVAICAPSIVSRNHCDAQVCKEAKRETRQNRTRRVITSDDALVTG